MATITESAAARPSIQPGAEQRIVLRGVSWETFQTLRGEIGDVPILTAYLDGEMELMSPGAYHEGCKKRLDRLVQILTDERDIPCKGLGSTLWADRTARRALEPDECYLLTSEKVSAACPSPKDVADLPRPDLAIEIDMRRGGVDRARIHAALGVSEVWRFDGATLWIDRLGVAGDYEPADASLFLPIAPAEVARWVLDDESGDDNAWARRFRASVRADRRAGDG